MKAFVVFILVSLADLSRQAEWSYDYQTEWPGVCTTGMQQSPINIMTESVVEDKSYVHIRSQLKYRGYGNVKVQGKNNGHTLQWDAVPDGNSKPMISGGPLNGNYTFMQFHFHWLSEHAIDGMKYPMEIHMVHVKTGVPMAEALQREDGLAVIAIFALVSRALGADSALEEIMPDVAKLDNQSREKTDPRDIDLTRMMSPDPQSYYTYQGSLTTPLCQEAVTWLVMDQPVYITNEQYNAFYNVDVGSSYNYRNLQPSNRVVYRSIASCSNILMPSLAGTLVSLLSCLSSAVSSGFNKGLCTLTKMKKKILGETVKHCSKLH